MSLKKKPPIFEELDDELFARLPPLYRLMETGSSLEAEVDTCDYYDTSMTLSGFHRPISRTLTDPEAEAANE